MEVTREDLDQINDRLRPLVRRIADASVPLCQPGSRGVITAAGSGVLLQIGSRGYVLTASHVFDNAVAGQPIAAIVGSKFVVLRRDRRWRTVSNPARPDLADLAVAAVDDLPEETLVGARFITLDEIDPFGLGVEAAPSTSFLALGYPRSKQPKVAKDGSYAAFAYHFLTHREIAEPGSLESFSAAQHVLVGYDRWAFVGNPRVTQMPNPDGMSGGGLWRVPYALTAPNPDGRLIAILIEFRKPQRLIVASRIAETLRFLRSLDPANEQEINLRFPGLDVQAT